MTHDEIRALLAGTTEGEWEHHNWDVMEKPHVVAVPKEKGKWRCDGRYDLPHTPDDAAFIAASKSIVEQLLEENESKTKKIIEVLNWKMRPHDECERCGDGYDCGCGYYWRTKILDEAIERIKGLDN